MNRLPHDYLAPILDKMRERGIHDPPGKTMLALATMAWSLGECALAIEKTEPEPEEVVEAMHNVMMAYVQQIVVRDLKTEQDAIDNGVH